MSEETGEGSVEEGGGEETRQDPHVERFRPDPSQPAERPLVLSGLLGRSDRPGYTRLYLTRDLDYYVEFRSEDVIFSEPIPADEAPMRGLDATRLHVRRDTTIDYIWSRSARPVDEFDLDVKLGAPARGPWLPPETRGADCPGFTAFGCRWTELPGLGRCGPRDTIAITICRGNTCLDPCDTRITCDTCQTACGQATCETCQTNCNQATCATCDQATCQTCLTNCNQATCVACGTQDTCGRTCDCMTRNARVFTCGPNPQCR